MQRELTSNAYFETFLGKYMRFVGSFNQRSQGGRCGREYREGGIYPIVRNASPTYGNCRANTDNQGTPQPVAESTNVIFDNYT